MLILLSTFAKLTIAVCKCKELSCGSLQIFPVTSQNHSREVEGSNWRCRKLVKCQKNWSITGRHFVKSRGGSFCCNMVMISNILMPLWIISKEKCWKGMYVQGNLQFESSKSLSNLVFWLHWGKVSGFYCITVTVLPRRFYKETSLVFLYCWITSK